MSNEMDIKIIINNICENDKRYKAGAYLFILSALEYYINFKIKERRHISGKELSFAVYELALKEFGILAKEVLNNWGIYKTEDIGNIVYILINEKVLSKTESDRIEDFYNVFDFDEMFNEREILRNTIKKVTELPSIKCELKI
ncbi:MAG TPA: hypothetical protein PLD27_08410 [bacterium]|nr:hypothetical protein [bacterium]HOL48647.1 hypothetical protein [bacterium]HPQ19776.1 hypothetical protein [bacterium]